MTVDCINSGDISWQSMSTGLVLTMIPGLGFFEAGLLRSHHTVSLMMQMFSGIVLLSCVWFLFGYSLVFSGDLGGFIGNLSSVFFLGVSETTCNSLHPDIPEISFALFQMMFAAITPLLMTGAFAERMKFSSFVLFILLWEILIYFPVAHWVWGGGFLQQWGVLDFAGGITIHTTAGVGSLITAKLIGRRKGFHSHHGEVKPSNLPMATLGFSLLFVGWYGFNGGSALSSGSLAISAVASTQIAAVFSGLVWFILSWIRGGKPSLVAVLNGCLSGLAGITPASGYINYSSTVLLGVLLGFASYYSCVLLKSKLRIDDALDVSSVHGVTGIIGSLYIGIFSELSQNYSGGANGAAFGSAALLGKQFAAVGITILWTAVFTWIIIKIVISLSGGTMRISNEMEMRGGDGEMMEGRAYHKLERRRGNEEEGEGEEYEDCDNDHDGHDDDDHFHSSVQEDGDRHLLTHDDHSHSSSSSSVSLNDSHEIQIQRGESSHSRAAIPMKSNGNGKENGKNKNHSDHNDNIDHHQHQHHDDAASAPTSTTGSSSGTSSTNNNDMTIPLIQ